tara:strand:+ start:1164 stop:2378 length:1215 start_codon:yes stop_codon:yes gene_type:complete
MSWTDFSINSVAEVVTKGTTPTTYGMPFTEEGVNFIKAEALNGDATLDNNGFTYISEDTHEKLKRSQLCVNDVLITIAGANVGKCGIVREQHIPANTNQAVGIIRVDPKKASPRFIYYCFKNPRTFAVCQGMGGQAAQPNINLTVLKSFVFSGPENPEEQEKIAELIAKYDDLIENNRRRIQLLEESARLLYQEWFVHLRFPGHEQVKITDGIPEGWEKKPLTAIAEVNQISLKKGFDERIEYIDISCVSTHSISDTTWYEFSEAPGRARRIVKHRDILWSCVRPNRRSHVLVWEPHDRLIASTGFAVISATQVSPFFLYQSLTTNDYVGYLTNRAGGAAYPAVTAKVFEESLVLVPSRKLIEQYDDQVKNTYAQINMLQSQNVKLAQARDLLLPKLMSGELTI